MGNEFLCNKVRFNRVFLNEFRIKRERERARERKKNESQSAEVNCDVYKFSIFENDDEEHKKIYKIRYQLFLILTYTHERLTCYHPNDTTADRRNEREKIMEKKKKIRLNRAN